jgi:hypothetical protein
MFGFFIQKKRQEVRRMFQGRLNRSYFRQFRFGKRVDPRANFCEVLWVIPYDDSTGKPDFSRLFPLVTKDASSGGLALIHTEPFDCERVLVGLQEIEGSGAVFVDCMHEHSTPLGYGFYQIGLSPKEIVTLTAADLAELDRRLAILEQKLGKRQDLAVACT